MFKWPKLVWSFKDISNEAKQSVTCREPWRNFRKLIIQRSEGGYDLDPMQIFLNYASKWSMEIFRLVYRLFSEENYSVMSLYL